jgi:dTDP-4-dehydrorhamnose reductase
MRILVIGASGQMARSLVACERGDLSIISFGRTGVDLRIPSTLEAAMVEQRPDVVVNAAAYTAVDRAESEPEVAHAVNARGAGTLAGICQRAAVPLIHISTDYVFDGTKVGAYDERDAVCPINVYGRTKAEGEDRVSEAAERIVILRTSWLHSPYGRNFVSTMLEMASKRDEVSVVDDQLGCPTYAPHLATAIVQIAASMLTPGFKDWGIYHAAGTGETTWCGLALEVYAVSRWLRGPSANVKPISTAEFPTPARRPRNSRLDCSKLVATFGVALPNWRVGAALSVGESIGRSKTTIAA